MTYDHDVRQDGIHYDAGEEVPDLGSMVATSAEGAIRHYEGLSADLEKLKDVVKGEKYSGLATGSTAMCLDTGQYYKYERTTREFYEL